MVCYIDTASKLVIFISKVEFMDDSHVADAIGFLRNVQPPIYV